MIRLIIGGRVHWKSSATKVTHLSTILALGCLTSEFLWDTGISYPFSFPINFPLQCSISPPNEEITHMTEGKVEVPSSIMNLRIYIGS